MNLEVIIIVISFFAALTVYFQPGSPLYLKLFPPFLAMTILVELTASYFIVKYGENVSVYNIFNIVNFCFYYFVLREIITNKTAKKVIFYIMMIFLPLAVCNLLFVQKIGNFNSMTFSIGSLLIVGMCVYYFFELFQLPKAINLLREPAFWICSGLLFFFVCSFPFFGLINFISNASLLLLSRFVRVLIIVNVFLYSLFTIAFLCRIRIRRST
ncbi:MAG TPA: hypothetical protein VK543_02850 [Puia sp.]|nr:hypothetical protein [Puia sp.]